VSEGREKTIRINVKTILIGVRERKTSMHAQNGSRMLFLINSRILILIYKRDKI
jgi:hypothetical protein